MDDWKILLVLFVLIILFIIPTKDIRSYKNDDIVKIRTVVNVIFSIIIFFVYLFFLRGHKDKYFVLICLVSPISLIWIIEFIILDTYEFKKMQGTTIYFYKTNLIGTDVLKNKKDIDYIANEVRSIVAEKAEKTNLLLSCPAELCFAIGQKLKSPGLPEVSIYNYNAKQDNKWNWSITLDNKFE